MRVFQKSQHRSRVIERFLQIVSEEPHKSIRLLSHEFLRMELCEASVRHVGVTRYKRDIQFFILSIQGDTEILTTDGLFYDLKELKKIVSNYQ